MNPIVKNILAVIAGVVVFNIVNIGIVLLGVLIVPAPAGVNVWDPESIKASMPLFQTKHFITPFLAHALGTLVGAFVAAKIAATRKMTFALVIGVLALIGGILNASMISFPMWFMVLDLVAAYIPMALIGGKLGSRSKVASETISGGDLVAEGDKDNSTG